MKFQTRLFLMWGACVLLLWAGTWWPVRRAISTSFTQLAADQFSATRRDLHAQQAERIRSMRHSAALLMNMPELRALIAEHNFEVSTENLASLQERLDNISQILGVSFVCVLDSRGNVIAQNSDSPWKTLPALQQYLLQTPGGVAMVQSVFQGASGSVKSASADAAGTWAVDGKLLQAIGVPLVFNSDSGEAPAADGGFIMAVPLTDDLATTLAQSHKCHVTFFAGRDVAASSLAPGDRPALAEAVNSPSHRNQREFTLQIAGQTYQTSVDPIVDTASNLPVGAMVVQSDMHDAVAAQKSVSTRLILSMLGGLLAAGIASFFVSGAVTRPVRELARGVRQLAKCDLDVQVNIKTRDELGQLATTFNDMVRQLRVRRELERAVEEARASTKAKGEFLATMSHEIRTPLNGVIGMAELLLRSTLNDQQRRYAGLVKSSAEVLTTLINDILDFSKLEAGKLELESVEFNLHEMVEDVVELLSVKAMGKGLEVACDIESSIPSHVRGDPTRVRQIIVNLVNNAVKFTEQGQVIVRVAPGTDCGAGKFRFAISDSGIGIPADRMNRLFQSFSQVDASTTRRFGGTGLGLAICKQLAELMGGTIGVSSQAGSGSTFWFEIPLAASSQTDAPLPAMLRGRRVLVAAANETCRELLCRKLLNLGCVADGVGSASAAVDALAETVGSYQIVLAEKELPGFERIIFPPGTRCVWLVPLNAGLGMDGAGDAARYVTKPVRCRQLIGILCDAIRPCGAGTAHAHGEKAQEHPLRGAGRRILVADDNPVNQEIAVELLATMGYRCEVVGDGDAAIAAWEKGGFDLVLMDCQMPIRDGFDAVRFIREKEKIGSSASDAKRIPIIALTANASEADRHKCVDAGMDAHCGKPFNVEQLLSTIRSLLPNDATAGVQSAADVPPVAPMQPANLKSDISNSQTSTWPPIEVAVLLRRCTNNPKLALSVLDKFTQQAAEVSGALQKELLAGDLAAVGRASHRLRGTAGILGAQRLLDLAERVETLSAQASRDGIETAIADLTAQIRECAGYVETVRREITEPKPSAVS